MLKDKEQKIVKNNKHVLEQYRQNKTTLSVEQYDKDTGKKIRTFTNRYQAAAWILANGLTNYRYRGIGQTRCAIAGALTASLTGTPYAYGYMWKYTLNPKNPERYTALPRGGALASAKVKQPISIYDKNGNRKDYDTIKEACIAHGIKRYRTENLKSNCLKTNHIVYIRETYKQSGTGKKIIK